MTVIYTVHICTAVPSSSLLIRERFSFFSVHFSKRNNKGSAGCFWKAIIFQRARLASIKIGNCFFNITNLL